MFVFQLCWETIRRLFCESGWNDRGDLRLERGLVCGHFSAQRELKYLIGSFTFKYLIGSFTFECLTGISNCESVTILQKQQLQHCRPWGPAQRHNILIYTIKTINSQNRRSSSMSRAYPLTQTSLFHRFCSKILLIFFVEPTSISFCVEPTVCVHCLHYLGKVTPVKVYEYIPTLLCCVQQFTRLNWTVYALHE